MSGKEKNFNLFLHWQNNGLTKTACTLLRLLLFPGVQYAVRLRTRWDTGWISWRIISLWAVCSKTVSLLGVYGRYLITEALDNAETKFDIANEREALDELNSVCWGTRCFCAIFHDCGANVVSKIINCTRGGRGLECARSQTSACFQQYSPNTYTYKHRNNNTHSHFAHNHWSVAPRITVQLLYKSIKNKETNEEHKQPNTTIATTIHGCMNEADWENKAGLQRHFSSFCSCRIMATLVSPPDILGGFVHRRDEWCWGRVAHCQSCEC